MLAELKGPACPRCGCRDGETLMGQVRRGQPGNLKQCRYCSRRFWVPAEGHAQAESTPLEGAVAYVSVRCPRCDSQARVTSTRSPLRWHKCVSCGHTFKSVEGP